jgi:hypothetical protein
MYLLGAISGSLAILVSYLSTRQAIVCAAVILFVALAGVMLLERAPYERQDKKSATIS